MQPQDPNTPPSPTPQPAQPPVPPTPPTPGGPEAPVNTTPSATPGGPPTDPMGSGMGAPTFTPASAAAGEGKKKMTMIIVAVAALLIVLVGGWFAYTKFVGGGIKLTEYSNENISLMVPADYEQKEENGGGTWTEKNAAKDDESTVVAYYQAYPEELTDEELTKVKEELKSQLENAASSMTTDPSEKVEDLKVTDIKFNGKDALKLTGTATRDGKKIGTITMVAIADNKAVYLVGVAAHTSDPGLAKKTDTIINSFKPKN